MTSISTAFLHMNVRVAGHADDGDGDDDDGIKGLRAQPPGKPVRMRIYIYIYIYRYKLYKGYIKGYIGVYRGILNVFLRFWGLGPIPLHPERFVMQFGATDAQNG